jgi:hypothetical protein
MSGCKLVPEGKCVVLCNAVNKIDVPDFHSIWIIKDKKDKGKAIPLQALTGPEGSRRLRLPDFKTIGTRM